MELIPTSLGRTLRERRKKLGLSQAKVAELSGKTQSQIARMEQGIGNPHISSVVEVTRALGTELLAIPIRLLPAIRHLILAHEHGAQPRFPKLVGNDPEDVEEDGGDDE